MLSREGGPWSARTLSQTELRSLTGQVSVGPGGDLEMDGPEGSPRGPLSQALPETPDTSVPARRGGGGEELKALPYEGRYTTPVQ